MSMSRFFQIHDPISPRHKTFLIEEAKVAVQDMSFRKSSFTGTGRTVGTSTVETMSQPSDQFSRPQGGNAGQQDIKAAIDVASNIAAGHNNKIAKIEGEKIPDGGLKSLTVKDNDAHGTNNEIGTIVSKR